MAYSTLWLLGSGASVAGHLGLCRSVAMHAELSRRFYVEGKPPQGLPAGWTPWCNPGFLVRALQELMPDIHDQDVRALCEGFIAQARDLDGVNEAMASLSAQELGPAPVPSRNGQALTARLESIEQESDRLWRRLQARIAQLGGEEARPPQA